MLVHPQFDPIAIHIGSFGIHWYGLMYLTAFMAFLWLGKYRIQTNPQAGFSIQMLDDMLFYGALGVILGGRLGYVLFYQPAHFFAHPAGDPRSLARRYVISRRVFRRTHGDAVCRT